MAEASGPPGCRGEFLHDLQLHGVHITPELVARLSPYLTEHLKRFGHYILDMETPPESLRPKPLFVMAP